jgi:hypothetical protein
MRLPHDRAAISFNTPFRAGGVRGKWAVIEQFLIWKLNNRLAHTISVTRKDMSQHPGYYHTEQGQSILSEVEGSVQLKDWEASHGSRCQELFPEPNKEGI